MESVNLCMMGVVEHNRKEVISFLQTQMINPLIISLIITDYPVFPNANTLKVTIFNLRLVKHAMLINMAFK